MGRAQVLNLGLTLCLRVSLSAFVFARSQSWAYLFLPEQPISRFECVSQVGEPPAISNAADLSPERLARPFVPEQPVGWLARCFRRCNGGAIKPVLPENDCGNKLIID